MYTHFKRKCTDRLPYDSVPFILKFSLRRTKKLLRTIDRNSTDTCLMGTSVQSCPELSGASLQFSLVYLCVPATSSTTTCICTLFRILICNQNKPSFNFYCLLWLSLVPRFWVYNLLKLLIFSIAHTSPYQSHLIFSRLSRLIQKLSLYN